MKRSILLLFVMLSSISAGVSFAQTPFILTPGDGANYDSFGTAVSINGNWLVVGSTGDDDGGGNAGSAYIFRRDGLSWIRQAKLMASDARLNANFGNAVSIYGDRVAIAAWNHNDAAPGKGAVYIFRREGANWI